MTAWKCQHLQDTNEFLPVFPDTRYGLSLFCGSLRHSSYCYTVIDEADVCVHARDVRGIHIVSYDASIIRMVLVTSRRWSC